ncbi:MAG: indole-3-glycerol phosphate synthase TrpC [Chloroflexota bacterium]|nr:MAG: indole-3-glycerol phosphate synthase TrpC [Chloroflexota bacterium]
MILDDIVRVKRAEIEKRRARISQNEFRARAENSPPVKNFADALRGGECVALIAEIKPASPSRGDLNANADPVKIARVYDENGASAISVLTDRQFFKGDLNNLKAARVGADVPLLRKDFIIDEYQVYESRALQADAILLIVRILDDAQLRAYRELAQAFEMAALVEIHDERELERALKSDAHIIGINNRNLADFTVDLVVTENLAPKIPREKIAVSESGIFTRADVERARNAGAGAVLVGEALMRAADVGEKVRELMSVKRDE